MNREYLIWANKHGGAFYRSESKGYTINPDIAGRFTKEEAHAETENTHGVCERWHEYSPAVIQKRKEYLEKKQREIRACLESMTPKQVLEILPELIQERIDLLIKGGI